MTERMLLRGVGDGERDSIKMACLIVQGIILGQAGIIAPPANVTWLHFPQAWTSCTPQTPGESSPSIFL